MSQELEAFTDIVDKQRNAAVEILSKNAIALQNEIATFGTRWNSIKPTEVEISELSGVEDTLNNLETYLGDFDYLRDEVSKISQSFSQFSLEEPDFHAIDNIQADLDSTLSAWRILHEYIVELDGIKEKSWIDFRSNVFILEDLRVKWNEKVKQINNNKMEQKMVFAHIIDDLVTIRLALPALKYCRGEAFKEDHWSELLQGKLGLPGLVRLDNLTCRHFFLAISILGEPSSLKFVKDLQAR